MPDALFATGRAVRAVDLREPPVLATRFACTFAPFFFVFFAENLAPVVMVREVPVRGDPDERADADFAAFRVAAGGLAVGALAAGALASGAFVAGALASGAFASGAFASGALAAGAFAAGAFAAGEGAALAGAAGRTASACGASISRAAAGAPGATFFFGRPPFRAARAAAIIASNSRFASAINCACGVRRSRAFSFSTL
ncbi:MAG TPA: hypothetical protein VMM18_09810 [Gemmatimonadaceae bacterium]|nr:hypothetical protein [Gemmatimonadaceae bacterium]